MMTENEKLQAQALRQMHTRCISICRDITRILSLIEKTDEKSDILSLGAFQMVLSHEDEVSQLYADMSRACAYVIRAVDRRNGEV